MSREQLEKMTDDALAAMAHILDAMASMKRMVDVIAEARRIAAEPPVVELVPVDTHEPGGLDL